MRNPFIIGSMLKLSVFLHFAALSFHSYSTEVLSLPPPVFADTEVSTNFTFAVGEGSNRRLVFSLELEATPTNNVEIAIGCDADEDGLLSLDETALTVGYDCGEWFVRSAVKDSVTYSDIADSGVFRRTYEVRSRHVRRRADFGIIQRKVGKDANEGGIKTMNRRNFLAGAAAVGIASTANAAKFCCGAAKACTAKKGRILFGACRASVEDIKIMRDLGYDFWEWNASSAFDPTKDDSWWQTQKEEIAKRPLPLRSSNGFIPGTFRLTGPKADHGPALDYAETVLRRADDIGVKTVVFGSGGARNVPGDFTGPRENVPDLELGTRQYADFCRALVKRVADLKTVQVVIEPLRPKESNIINFVFQGLAICREVASPRLAQLADIFHMMMGGDNPASLVDAGPLLRHVHIADYKTRQFPGFDPRETARLKPFFDALKLAGYQGGVSCECAWGAEGDFAKNAAIAISTMKSLV